jgi:hypothetical protein
MMKMQLKKNACHILAFSSTIFNRPNFITAKSRVEVENLSTKISNCAP